MSFYGIWQLRRLSVIYSALGGSSRGARDFVGNHLPTFAADNPQIEIEVKEQQGHPVLKGTYRNNYVKEMDVRNMQPRQIMQRLLILRDSHGRTLTKNLKRHVTHKRSVQGRWTTTTNVSL